MNASPAPSPAVTCHDEWRKSNTISQPRWKFPEHFRRPDKQQCKQKQRQKSTSGIVNGATPSHTLGSLGDVLNVVQERLLEGRRPHPAHTPAFMNLPKAMAVMVGHGGDEKRRIDVNGTITRHQLVWLQKLETNLDKTERQQFQQQFQQQQEKQQQQQRRAHTHLKRARKPLHSATETLSRRRRPRSRSWLPITLVVVIVHHAVSIVGEGEAAFLHFLGHLRAPLPATVLRVEAVLPPDGLASPGTRKLFSDRGRSESCWNTQCQPVEYDTALGYHKL